MRIGIVIPEFPTQTHIFFWREVQALRRIGIEVHLLSTRRPSEPCPHTFREAASAETLYLYPPTRAAVRVLAGAPKGLLRVAWYIASLSRDRALAAVLTASAAELVAYARTHNLDHVHVHSCASAAHVAALARRLGGPPYSLHLHGDLPVYGTDHRQKFKLATFVAAAALPMEQQVIKAGLSDRTCTLRMGVDTDRFSPGDRSEGLGTPLRIVTVARLNVAKGHCYALEAISMLRARGVEVHYTVVGSGPHRPAIEADVVRYGLQDRVELVGSLDEEAVVDVLRGCDVFVLPSAGIGEASPVSVMEAMAAGLPVVVSQVGGTADMITDGIEGFLVAPGDAAAIAAALERVYRHREAWLRMGRSARDRAVKQFDSRVRARQFIDAIERFRAIA